MIATHASRLFSWQSGVELWGPHLAVGLNKQLLLLNGPWLIPQSTYFTVRGQSFFSRLPKYWPPIPLSARRVCTLCCGGRTDSPGGEGDGGSIFWNTREIRLPSYSKICTLWLIPSKKYDIACALPWKYWCCCYITVNSTMAASLYKLSPFISYFHSPIKTKCIIQCVLPLVQFFEFHDTFCLLQYDFSWQTSWRW